jgi:hypothetical protein
VSLKAGVCEQYICFGSPAARGGGLVGSDARLTFVAAAVVRAGGGSRTAYPGAVRLAQLLDCLRIAPVITRSLTLYVPFFVLTNRFE